MGVIYKIEAKQIEKCMVPPYMDYSGTYEHGSKKEAEQWRHFLIAHGCAVQLKESNEDNVGKRKQHTNK